MLFFSLFAHEIFITISSLFWLLPNVIARNRHSHSRFVQVVIVDVAQDLPVHMNVIVRSRGRKQNNYFMDFFLFPADNNSHDCVMISVRSAYVCASTCFLPMNGNGQLPMQPLLTDPFTISFSIVIVDFNCNLRGMLLRLSSVTHEWLRWSASGWTSTSKFTSNWR